ncbi:hypothetical protein SNE40_008764 [Patella caerulea]|uniref:DUF4430 domain-containing protein n=1 Tax=Patella caerulea TaxID=87958 RepID=A0AAN8JPS2_PATCE
MYFTSSISAIIDFFNFSNDCPAPNHVTLIARNQIQSPNFEFRQTVRKPPGTPLIRYLESAADQDSNFKFNATYFPSPLGYSIGCIHGLAGIWTPDRTWWKILGSDGQGLQLGVSSYVPEDNEVITFEFTKGGHCE